MGKWLLIFLFAQMVPRKERKAIFHHRNQHQELWKQKHQKIIVISLKIYCMTCERLVLCVKAADKAIALTSGLRDFGKINMLSGEALFKVLRKQKYKR